MVAASGVQMTGTPLQVLADTYFSTEMDAAMIRYAGDIEQVQKQSEAALARTEGGARAAVLNIKRMVHCSWRTTIGALMS